MFELEDCFGNRLREERLRLSMTQEQLSSKTGVSILSIGQYENGRSLPSIKFIYVLEKLRFDIPYLILAIRNADLIKKHSPEVYKKIAKEVDSLEFRLGEVLNNEIKVKIILSLLDYLDSAAPDEKTETAMSHLLSKIVP